MNNQLSYNIDQEIVSSSDCFIGANTQSISLEEIQSTHIVPSYTLDYEPLISVADFIRASRDVLHHFYQHETILPPSIRVSHPIKGRIPSARFKPTSELLEKEKTIYYERTMFIYEIPSINSNIDGKDMNLVFGGIKSYNEDRQNGRKGKPENFKVFIGFKVQVCSNLCIWTDGAKLNLKVRSIGEILDSILRMLHSYKPENQFNTLESLVDYHLSEKQLAQLIGRARLYQYLPLMEKKQIPELLFTDSQITAVARSYYEQDSFLKGNNGDISLWNLYNYLTDANKSSYIDQFTSRSINANELVLQLKDHLDGRNDSWFLS